MTVIEEGDKAFCEFNGAIESDQAGFTSTGYANVINAAGAKLTWAITIAKSGNYTFAVRYANGGTVARPGIFAIAQQSKNLNFAPSGGWTQWLDESVTLNLTAGTNIVTLSATTAEGLANIDSLTLKGPASVTAAMCPNSPPITVWIAGDSTVADGNTPCPVGWGKTIGDYFNDKVTIKNSALGGRSVRTWLYDVKDQAGSNGECKISTNSDGSPVLQSRWTSMLEQMRAGDYLIIQFGINDGAGTCPRHVGGTAFKNEYIYMANEAIKRGAHPILVTPSPALKCSGSTAVASRGFLTETFAVGNQLNIPVIDLHKQGTALYNQLAFCPVAGGDVSASTRGAVGEFFCDDHTHFDTPGARQIGGIIADALRAQSSPLANYLK
ncbi:MAG TPA: carbohydrate-binding protein [Cellvibrionaceae bacterium]